MSISCARCCYPYCSCTEQQPVPGSQEMYITTYSIRKRRLTHCCLQDTRIAKTQWDLYARVKCGGARTGSGTTRSSTRTTKSTTGRQSITSTMGDPHCSSSLYL